MADLARKQPTSNWADDDDDNELPAPLITTNPDGTKTVISFRINPETGNKVKVTQRIKMTVVKERVNPLIAERKRWTKFGLERGPRQGPDMKTTSLGENAPLKLFVGWKESKEEEVKVSAVETNKSKTIVCRNCHGEHFTSRCPFKDRFPSSDVASDSAVSSPGGAGTPEPTSAAPSSGAGGRSTYVPPHMRRGADSRGEGERMGGGMMRERDDSATLRVSNLGEDVEENDLGRLFERFGRIQRLYLAKDKDTGRTKGYAFIGFYNVMDAKRACDRLNGYGFQNLILSVEFSKRA
ncbi:eukaryotic translation initiation factor 3 subunit G-domain-containing protein [Limtongia smithiae]|uniref:eukaryotic translation initiation factor 3 subunit G-domain-containing protein n=1 Tax=Limtongia smithiae TaxID=1125753 RepID=UPI0034CDE181